VNFVFLLVCKAVVLAHGESKFADVHVSRNPERPRRRKPKPRAKERRKGAQRPNQSPIRGGGDHQVMTIRKVMAMRMMKTMMAMKVQDVESMMRQLVLLSIKWWP